MEKYVGRNCYLKVIGYTQYEEEEKPLEIFDDYGSQFWENRSKVWFGKHNRHNSMHIGDILIQYVPLGIPQKDFSGRIVGYYEVVSDFIYEKRERWTGYRLVKNLNLSFSLNSKMKTILSIKECISIIPKSIQSGCALLSNDVAISIISAINESGDRL